MWLCIYVFYGCESVMVLFEALNNFCLRLFLLIDKIEEAGSPNEFRRRAGTMGEDKTTKDLTSNRLPTIIKVKVLICEMANNLFRLFSVISNLRRGRGQSYFDFSSKVLSIISLHYKV